MAENKSVEAQRSGNLKGTHSALVKLLESAPIVQVRPVLKQKSSAYNGNRTDQNHFRKAELGTSKCPWKKSRICAEWLLKNQQQQQQEAANDQQQQQQSPLAEPVMSHVPHQHLNETDSIPKGDFLPPPPQAQPTEDVKMTDLESLVCTCHELQGQDGDDPSAVRRNSSDSTDDDELAKCDCGHCQHPQQQLNTVSPAKLLSQQRASSISDSGCDDSDCAENKITDLCNRFNENLSKDDVRKRTKTNSLLLLPQPL